MNLSFVQINKNTFLFDLALYLKNKINESVKYPKKNTSEIISSSSGCGCDSACKNATSTGKCSSLVDSDCKDVTFTGK